MTTLLIILLAVNLTALVVVTILYRRAKRAQRQRRVEAPNSQYKSPYVLDLEAQRRWEAVNLDLLHEVNREEFVKVLGKVKSQSVRALSPQDRAFLDRMVEAERRVRVARRRGQSPETSLGNGEPRPVHHGAG